MEVAAQAEDAATVVAEEDTAAAEATVEVQADAATVAAEEATVAEEVMAAEATPLVTDGAPAIPFPA
jgi:hypothetical protein